MTVDRLENSSIEQERKQLADGIPQSPVTAPPAEKDKRIAAHDLFNLFTATIIRSNEPFVR